MAQRRPKGFLDLPGELRNKIYQDCIRDDYMRQPGLTRLVFAPKPPPKHMLISIIISLLQMVPFLGWLFTPGFPRRDSVGLTQTSRLLREEYRPIFLTALEVAIRFEDLERYMSNFHSHPIPRSFKMKGSLHVEINIANNLLPTECNVLPLLRLRRDNELLSVKFFSCKIPTHARQFRDLNIIIRASNLWSAATLRLKFKEVRFCPGTYLDSGRLSRDTIVFVIVEEEEETWMRSSSWTLGTLRAFKGFLQSMQVWQREGLDICVGDLTYRWIGGEDRFYIQFRGAITWG
ncbi:hypothetical protein P154DRAFT_584513 [Amniculicola lignicola CBS 123094]|uniref:Uncharacterized protein n=1 Tax=Amniculicola lignicola CBS 123094 TaxID=1392246 RepID=A0A6A5X5B0_9PLEO|nr:hypothetical protein P154DRAFT_584513 [Amniculicola lignicola CBS 123094]